LKKIAVVKSSEVDIKPFVVSDFTQSKEKRDDVQKVSKKELRKLAKQIGLKYSDEEIVSIKKLIEAYMAKR